MYKYNKNMYQIWIKKTSKSNNKVKVNQVQITRSLLMKSRQKNKRILKQYAST